MVEYGQDMTINNCDFNGTDEGLDMLECHNMTVMDCTFDGFDDPLEIRECVDTHLEDIGITNTGNTALTFKYKSRRITGENIRINNSDEAVDIQEKCNVTLYNSSIENVTWNLIGSYEDAVLTCINTSMDFSPSMFVMSMYSGPGTGTLFHNGNFLNAWVSDTQGTIPNALREAISPRYCRQCSLMASRQRPACGCFGKAWAKSQRAISGSG